MSIYATLWTLKFPEHGDPHTGCEWVEVLAQAVPDFVTHGAEFLPWDRAELHGSGYMAVVIIRARTEKGTQRSGQEYVSPLCVMSGAEYAHLSFDALHERICDALRGDRPRMIAELMQKDGSTLVFEDDSSRTVKKKRA